jgi:S-adenosylmethionine hydrolase
VSGRIRGKIIEVTAEGDLVTDLEAAQLTGVSRGSDTKVTVDEEHDTFGIFPSNHEQPPMTLVAILDPNGPLRLHLVSDSASMMLGVRAGASVEINW